MEDFDDLQDFGVFVQNGNRGTVHRQARSQRRRAIHVDEMSDAEFLRTFRFTKQRVGELCDMLRDSLEFPTNRNVPLTVEQQVPVAAINS